MAFSDIILSDPNQKDKPYDSILRLAQDVSTLTQGDVVLTQSVASTNQTVTQNQQTTNQNLALKEDKINKATNFSTIDDIFYPTVKAVDDFIAKDIASAGIITRTGGLISSLSLTKSLGTDVVTINRDGNNRISSIVSVYNSVTKTTTLIRDGNGIITDFNVVIT